jgi:hypothetical protein
MISDKKDIFGLGGLTNPSYTVDQSAIIEKSFISDGDSAPADAQETEAESTSAELQRRLAEIERNVGCAVFGPSASEPAPPPREEPARPQITLSTEGLRHTEEAQKRDRLASALSALSIGSDGFLDADHELDRKLMMIEEIEDLVTTFKEEGESMDHVHIPDKNDPIETIQCTLKILKKHNDRKRYGNLADDCLMLAATSLEMLCDGKRSWIGFKPDLSGWASHVRAKLRRMHHDTSQIASSVMNDYNIGPAARLVLELVPNMIMYARNKSAKNAEGASSDPVFDSAINDLSRAREDSAN